MRKEKLEELNHLIKLVTPIEIPKPNDWPEELDRPFITSEPHFFSIKDKIIKRDQLIKGGKKGNAVDIIALDKDNNVTLVVQPRCFTDTKVGIEIPAGYIEDGEKPEDAALRELKEETGLSPTHMEFLTWCYQDEGSSSSKIYLYIATGCKKVAKQNLDFDEIIKLYTCTFDEAKELINMGYIRGASSKMTILLAEKYLQN